MVVDDLELRQLARNHHLFQGAQRRQFLMVGDILHQYRKSSDVNGVPSDQRCPSRSLSVKTRPCCTSTPARISGFSWYFAS